MAAKDIFHDAVRRALEKEGWRITHDPLFLRFGGLDMYIASAQKKFLQRKEVKKKLRLRSKVLSVHLLQLSLVPLWDSFSNIN